MDAIGVWAIIRSIYLEASGREVDATSNCHVESFTVHQIDVMYHTIRYFLELN